MNTSAQSVTEEELVAYLLGELPAERTQVIRQLAATDSELAGQIQVLRFIAGRTFDTVENSTLVAGLQPQRQQTKRSRFRLVSKIAVSVLILLVVAGLGWASWNALFAPRPLLSDNFETDWLDPTKWKTGRRSTTALDGYARLNDRGSLVTVQEFNEPIAIELDWRWIDLVGDISYRDTLTIALHTTGEHADKHPFEILDGLIVSFMTHCGQASLLWSDPEYHNPYTPEGSLPMPAGKWHRIRIVDDGKSISVYFAGPAIDKKEHAKPVLSAPYKNRFGKHHIAIYNREFVAKATHESHIRNVVIWPLTKTPP